MACSPMRTNEPVTQREYHLPDNATLMSTTDLKSHIAYANAAFIQVSGFEREEILGQAHNMVRHPDMPREAFADMWATLKQGLSWTALVKNRRKDGDHYWVRANATPVRRNGQVSGYMSVRTKPTRQEVEHAEALYARFREGRAGRRAFHHGLVVRTGWLAWTSALQLMPVKWRIRSALMGCTLGMLSLSALTVGLSGMPLLIWLASMSAVLLTCNLWLERQIASPLQAALAQALNVAAGQPSENVHLDRVDEIGMIMRAINQSGLNLRSLVDDVGAQVSGMRMASGEIASGNADLSSRTEQAAANLQQTAASMEQISSTVKNNADAARQAAQLAQTASTVAGKGGEAVKQVMSTMEDITTSSKRIGDIIGVIDGIAFQTNILALNAAVEAARAGEQGRGFAVVASEVRSLAQRSAEAAKEIKSLIGASADKVEAGSRLAQDAGSTMADVVNSVRQVTDLIGNISAATAEQTTGIGQVSEAVSQLDQATQQNAALVEESAAAADSLQQQAVKLVDAVNVFRTTLDEDAVPRAVAAARPVRPAAKPTRAMQAMPLKLAPSGQDWSSF